jgi:hypothetical protein
MWLATSIILGFHKKISWMLRWMLLTAFLPSVAA